MFSKKLSILIIVCFIFSFLSGHDVNTDPIQFRIAGLVVSDIGVQDQWYLKKIKASDAWSKTKGSKDIVVAIIDTGMDLDHPDLKENLWINEDEIPKNGIDDDNNGYIDDINGWNFAEKNNIPEPDPQGEYVKIAINHGTVVAGIIAAQGNNAFAGAGIAWRARIMPLRAFDNMGDSDSYLVETAIQYAIDNGADIINMSFVGLGYSSSLEKKIEKAYKAGILLVAAAGNDNGSLGGDNVKSYPVCYDGPDGQNWILGVAAVDEDDKLAKFSNFGASCVDLSAPGTNISSSLFFKSSHKNFKEYFGGTFKGTSVSSAQVAGAAVLVKASHSNYTNKEIAQVLIQSADDISDINPTYNGKLGSGRLNILKAVESKAISMETEEELKIKYVLSANVGDEPKIWFLDSTGSILKEFYAFSPNFRGGINLALGDIDNDGMVEVIAGAGSRGGPHVRIFNLKGELEYQFFAYDKNRRNGVFVAVGDTNGDGRNEIVAVEAGQTKPLARILDKNGNILKNKIEIFESYMKNGISLALGDINKDGKEEIIASSAAGTVSKIRVLNREGKKLGEFFPYGSKFYGGLNIAVADLNNTGWAEILVASASSRDSFIKEYTYEGRLLSPGFYSYQPSLLLQGRESGISISSGDKNSDNKYETITVSNGRNTKVKVWDNKFNLKMTFYPFGKESKRKVSAYIVTR